MILDLCPFCGSRAELVLDDEKEPDLWVVSCLGCIASIEEVGKDYATTAWNRRPMTEKTFTLEQITHAAASPYAAALKEKSVERALRIFTDLLVDGLKALPARVPAVTAPRLPQRSD